MRIPPILGLALCALTSLPLAGGSSSVVGNPRGGAQYHTNRIRLHSGGDGTGSSTLGGFAGIPGPVADLGPQDPLNDPPIGSQPELGNFDGDLYYKVWPGYATQRCDGTGLWTGLIYTLVDQDWSNGATLWSHFLVEAFEQPNGVLQPEYSDPNMTGVLLPQVDDIGLPNPGCPGPGQIAGYRVVETFLDTLTGEVAPIPIPCDSVDRHWSITGFFPTPNAATSGSVSFPPVNSCGTAGDASLMWLRTPENQVDWLNNGFSAYGGFQDGAAPGLQPEIPQHGSDLEMTFLRASLNMYVDVGLNPGPLEEEGLAGLNPALGLEPGGAIVSQPRIGVRITDQEALSAGPNAVGAVVMNLGTPAIDIGACLAIPGLGSLALNPGEPTLTLLTNLWGILPVLPGGVDLTGDALGDQGFYTSNLIPIMPLPLLIDRTVTLQGFTFDFISGAEIGTSNIVRFTFRLNT